MSVIDNSEAVKNIEFKKVGTTGGSREKNKL